MVAWAGLRLRLKSRSVVKLKCPIEHGIVTNWDDMEKSGITHCSLRLSSWHHGRYGPEGDIRCIGEEASGIHDTSRICTPMSCCQVARPCSKGLVSASFFVASSGHDRCYQALRPFRLCERRLELVQPAGATVALHAHSGVYCWLVVAC